MATVTTHTELALQDANSLITALSKQARNAFAEISNAPSSQRNEALRCAAKYVRDSQEQILQANALDIEAGRQSGLTEAFIDRLSLSEDRIEAMAKGLEDIASLADPLGVELARWTVPSGLDIARISTALGVIGVIYESRPNVTIDASGLAIKSGNCVILRGGSDSHHTSTLLAELIQKGLAEAGLNTHAVQMVPTTDRQAVGSLLQASGKIDVIIPRGGRNLVERVQNEARVPVFAHLEGICYIYIAADADTQKAVNIAVNAKMRRVGICQALRKLSFWIAPCQNTPNRPFVKPC